MTFRNKNDLSNTTVRGALSLAMLAMCAVTLLSLVQMASTERTLANHKARLNQQLDDVLAGIERNNDPALDVLMVSDPQLGTGAPMTLYRARQDGRATGLVMTSEAPDGYSGEIRLLVGVDYHGTLLGTRVLEHRETPGIGDRIELRRSDWITFMDGHSLDDPASDQWHTRVPDGAFDAITGATITSEAVISSIHDALSWFKGNQQSAFAIPDASSTLGLSANTGPAFTDPASTGPAAYAIKENVRHSDTMDE